MTEDSRVEELVYIMKKVGLNLTAQIDCCLGNQELSGVQTYFLVYFLRHHPEGTYLTEVCHETGMSKATLSALIKKLRGKGYLCFREIPGDIRKKQILPTERLLTEGGELMEKTKQMEEEVCSALSQEEKRQLWVLEQKVLLKLMQMEHKGKNKGNSDAVYHSYDHRQRTGGRQLAGRLPVRRDHGRDGFLKPFLRRHGGKKMLPERRQVCRRICGKRFTPIFRLFLFPISISSASRVW